MRWFIVVVACSGLVACAVGDNSKPSNAYGGYGSGPADDPNADDESDDGDDEASSGAAGSDDGAESQADDGAGESEGGFPTPEPDDDPPPDDEPDPTGGNPPPPPPPMGGDCCTPTMTPGCANDPAVEMCVCGGDDFCCTMAWDETCVSEVANCAPACPGAEPPDMGGGGSPCCAPTGGPGCGDPFAEACVCLLDDYCCTTDWDDQCVGIATLACMIC
ncbi:MAG TPA: hypothetical protein VG755_07760 [Nannocystaceae bacterium]|nr:hypothetical protein [Nannocystaceae bacterium]